MSMCGIIMQDGTECTNEVHAAVPLNLCVPHLAEAAEWVSGWTTCRTTRCSPSSLAVCILRRYDTVSSRRLVSGLRNGSRSPMNSRRTSRRCKIRTATRGRHGADGFPTRRVVGRPESTVIPKTRVRQVVERVSHLRMRGPFLMPMKGAVMRSCTECRRLMRPRGASKQQAPDTVAYATGGLCMSCYDRAGGKRAIPAAQDGACVTVKAQLRPSVYRALALFAKENHVDVGMVLSKLADQAVSNVKPVETPKRNLEQKQIEPREPKDELDHRIVHLNGAGMTDLAISAVVGIHQTAVSRRRRTMGLVSPKPRTVRQAA